MIKVLKDLERLDMMDSLYYNCNMRNGALTEIIQIKDAQLIAKEKKAEALKDIIEEKEKDIAGKDEEIKGLKRKVRAYQIGGVALVVLVLLL